MPDETELASLKREFDELRDQFSEFREQRQFDIHELAASLESVGLTRRKAMTAAAIAIGGGIGGAGFIAGQESAQAVSSGQVGTAASPLTAVFADSATLGNVAISSDIYTRGNVADASTVVVSETEDGSGTVVSDQRVQRTAGVSTSATTILNISFRGCLVGVAGTIQGASQPSFHEIVSATNNGDANVAASSTRGSPAARTYTVSGSDLQLAMGADTYDIVATGVRGGDP